MEKVNFLTILLRNEKYQDYKRLYYHYVGRCGEHREKLDLVIAQSPWDDELKTLFHKLRDELDFLETQRDFFFKKHNDVYYDLLKSYQLNESFNEDPDDPFYISPDDLEFPDVVAPEEDVEESEYTSAELAQQIEEIEYNEFLHSALSDHLKVYDRVSNFYNQPDRSRCILKNTFHQTYQDCNKLWMNYFLSIPDDIYQLTNEQLADIITKLNIEYHQFSERCVDMFFDYHVYHIDYHPFR